MVQLRGPRRSVPLSRQVAEQIEELITSGRWAVGERVPSEHELVEQLGVSRNTVREALRALVYTGLLAARPGDGTYVQASSELDAVLARRSRRCGVEQVREVRAMLETEAARLAARRRSASDSERLRALLNRLHEAEAVGDPVEIALADGELHRAVVAGAANPLLTDLYDSLGSARAEALVSAVERPDQAGHQQRQHTRLVDAIAEGDETSAAAAAAAIVAGAEQGAAR
ncbi:FadR/GntR family transcriptional regulator [Pseudonocardia spinosispora]|uniref:FadR/GntR family transcriptional regulator n=1 Tax=Pseudonocardia spinosispora TaxID=103441 RepID=UPI00041F9DB6|nr:FCD domain-containing protein [Pseudonocardia spinosispora]